MLPLEECSRRPTSLAIFINGDVEYKKTLDGINRMLLTGWLLKNSIFRSSIRITGPVKVSWCSCVSEPLVKCFWPPILGGGREGTVSERQKLRFEDTADSVDVKFSERVVQLPDTQNFIRVMVEGLELA
jgi:hypothetical protein